MRARVAAGVAREISRRRPGARKDERWLSRAWERQAFDRHNLRSTSGVAFQVVYPGHCTGQAGPDFHDAILALADGRLVRGDVELHLESAGWQQHGHHRDPAYERVVLHVVLDASAPTHNSRGEPVMTVELRDRLPGGGRRGPDLMELEDQAHGAEQAQLSYVVHPCKNAIPATGHTGLKATLEGLAVERFQAKQAVFEGELTVYEPEQVLYAAMLDALGYSRNRVPFRQLAQAVPVSTVASQSGAQGIEQLLLAGAGMLEDGAVALAQAGLIPRQLTQGAWERVGVRPDNWPEKRIRQISAILRRLLPLGLLDELMAPLLDLDRSSSPRTAVRGLRQQWQVALAEVGAQRADAIAVNVLLPFAAAYGQSTYQFLLTELADQAFLAYPAEGANQVTRYMRREILGDVAGAASGAAGEQALQHVWDRWCHEKVCVLCPLGRRQSQSAGR